MDEIARYNEQRWRALSEVQAVFTRPYTDLDAQQARERLDPKGRYGDLRGVKVLCLASGGRAAVSGLRSVGGRGHCGRSLRRAA